MKSGRTFVQDSAHTCKADLLLRSTLINRSQQWLYLTQQQHAVHHLSSPWRCRRKRIYISDKLGQSMYREGIVFGSTDTCLTCLTYFSVYVGHTQGFVEESSSWDSSNSGKGTKKKKKNTQQHERAVAFAHRPPAVNKAGWNICKCLEHRRRPRHVSHQLY